MKRHTLLTILAAALTTLPCTAQNWQLKIGGGLSTVSRDAAPVGAFKGGIGYEVEFDQHWTLTPALCIYGKGWKNHNQTVFLYDEEGQQLYDEEGQPRTGIKNRTTTANYLELPLLFNYYARLSEGHYLVFSAGPYAAVGLSGKQKTKGDTEQQEGGRRFYYETRTFKESGTHRFEAGLTAGIGYQLPSHMTVGIEADYGLTKFNDRGLHNIAALLTLAYQF
ncbi:MAG: PorT family protein [Alloprevotella sp.]|nr:PorT family protein [Alloprevotella sp.]